MDNYRGAKAQLRRSPTDVTKFNPDTTPASNQEKISGHSPRTVPVANGSNLSAGNQVRVQANTEDTSKIGDPLQSYQRIVMAAVLNPDAGVERSTLRVAKKASDKEIL